MIRRTPSSTLFPYPTLFGSKSDEVALTPCLDLQDGEAVLGIVEGDPLHRARQCLSRRTCGGVSAHGNDGHGDQAGAGADRKSTRLNSSHANISYAVFCLKKN